MKDPHIGRRATDRRVIVTITNGLGNEIFMNTPSFEVEHLQKFLDRVQDAIDKSREKD